MKKLSLVLLFVLAVSVPSHARPKFSHVLAHAAVVTAKNPVKAAGISVVATLKGIEKTVGGAFWMSEPVPDVIAAGAQAVATATSKEFKYNPFVIPAKVAGYVDVNFWEGAENYLLGKSN